MSKDHQCEVLFCKVLFLCGDDVHRMLTCFFFVFCFFEKESMYVVLTALDCVDVVDLELTKALLSLPPKY